MGYDVSYHPISEDEIHDWYFSLLGNIKKGDEKAARKLSGKHKIDRFYIDKYVSILGLGANTSADEPFEKSHGLYIAVVQGFFRTYFYTRNAAFSFLIEQDDIFRKYTKPWQDILRVRVDNPIQNFIIENYSSGVYLPFDQLKQLTKDYENLPNVRERMDGIYSHQRIDIFMKAVRFAVENDLGILEATEVVEPYPFDLNKSKCYSNLFNCDKDGALLYEKTAILDFALAQQDAKSEDLKRN